MAESEGDFLNAAICVTAPPVFVPRFGEIICGGKKDFSEEDVGRSKVRGGNHAILLTQTCLSSVTAALSLIQAWLISAQLFLLLLLLPDPCSQSVIVCLHRIFDQLPGRCCGDSRLAIFDLWAGLAMNRRRCVGDQPCLNTPAQAGSQCCASKFCRQLAARTLTFFHLGASFLYLGTLLHIPRSAAAAGGSGGCREGWFVINTPSPPPALPCTSSASLRSPWLFLHPLLVSSWLHAVQSLHLWLQGEL